MTFNHHSSSRQSDIALTEPDFLRIAKVAKSNWGLNLETAKMPLIRSRLGRRLIALNLKSFSAYCSILEKGSSSESEHFISALTTNVTHFYRELHHFEFLEKKVFPELIKRAKSGEKIRIWSAGCSTGQEPYSLAGSLLRTTNDIERLDVKIIATDVDNQVLKKAEKGSYHKSDCNFPNTDLQKRLFGAVDGDIISVKPNIRRLVTFRQLNLMAHWPMVEKFDIIMCRNVAIYFDKQTQENLWTRFTCSLNPNGYLLIGHSERIAAPAPNGLTPVGITSYQFDATSDQLKPTLKGK